MGQDNFEKKDVELCTNFSKGFLNCASKSDFVFEISGKIWPGHNLRNCCKNSGCVIEAFREHFCFSNVLVTILCNLLNFEDSFIPSKLGKGCTPLFADVQINKLIHTFYRAGKGKRDQFRTNADKREYGILHARRQARTQPLQDGRRKSSKKGKTPHQRRQAWIRNSACTPTSVNTAQKRKQPPENTHASTRKNEDKTFDFAIILPRFVYDKSSAKSNAGSGFSV